MSPFNRRAFALKELLVLLALVIAVVGFSVISLGSARERARQGVCLSNMRQVGMAVGNYESADGSGTYLGYKNYVRYKNGSSFKAPSFPNCPYPLSMQGQDVAVSWFSEVLPYLDSPRPADTWKRSMERDPPVESRGANLNYQYWFPCLELLVCPSDPPINLDGAPTSMVVNTGMRDGSTPEARDFVENGVFHDHFTDFLPEANATDSRKALTKVSHAFIDQRGDGL